MIFGEHVDEAADMMAAACMKPQLLVGGDAKTYGLEGMDEVRYVTVSGELSACFGARGVVSDDCVQFLKSVTIPDKLHTHADYVETWSAFIVATVMRAPYARSLQEATIKRRAQKGLTFSDRGNHTRVVNDLRKWLLSGAL